MSKYDSGFFGGKNDFVLLVVLFILLIIVGSNYSGYHYY
ncbi:MAG: YjcZ family sporulation protein [Bacilli bacterium]|uniref:YjcZ family sporulation protein n=1 Tax=Ureibacillus suwonensis TaxID=313007 RepID=A0ABW0RBU6_9BACL|nr:sporulation protein YjcZ [Bacilli bacterium]